MALIPGFQDMASTLMRKTMDKKGVARVEELRALCLEADVKLVACQMTVDLFGLRQGGLHTGDRRVGRGDELPAPGTQRRCESFRLIVGGAPAPPSHGRPESLPGRWRRIRPASSHGRLTDPVSPYPRKRALPFALLAHCRPIGLALR
jgi:hypothetical protein